MLNIDAEYLRSISSKNKNYTVLLEELLKVAKEEAEIGNTSSYYYANIWDYDIYEVEIAEKELEKRGFTVNIEYNVTTTDDDNNYHVIRIHW